MFYFLSVCNIEFQIADFCSCALRDCEKDVQIEFFTAAREFD